MSTLGGEAPPQHAHMRSSTLSLGYDAGEVDPTGLPFGQLNEGADLEEYITETRTGNIVRHTRSNVTGEVADWKVVTFTIDDPENPKNWSKAYKWYITAVIAFTCFVVAFASAVVTAGLDGPVKEFHVSLEVSLLTITVFVIGFGVGKFLDLSSSVDQVTDTNPRFLRSHGFCATV